MRRGRVLGVPAVGAGFGGNLSLAWLPLTVMQEVCRGAVPGDHRIGEQPCELGQVVGLPGPQQQPGGLDLGHRGTVAKSTPTSSFWRRS
jgi:hypothetical protein